MKKIVLLLFVLSSLELMAQIPSTHYFYLDGTPISMPKKSNSINEVFDLHFKDYKVIQIVLSFYEPLSEFEVEVDFDIVCQEYSMEPLFINGGSGFEDKKRKRLLKKVLKRFNEYFDFKKSIRDYDYIWGAHLDRAIREGHGNFLFLETLGSPESTYMNSRGLMVYDYGTIILTFRNGNLARYSFRNRLP